MMLPDEPGGDAGHCPVAGDVDAHYVRKQIDDFGRSEGSGAGKPTFAALSAPERVEASEQWIGQIARLQCTFFENRGPIRPGGIDAMLHERAPLPVPAQLVSLPMTSHFFLDSMNRSLTVRAGW